MTNDTAYAPAPEIGREARQVNARLARLEQWAWGDCPPERLAYLTAEIAALSQPAPAAADAGLREAATALLEGWKRFRASDGNHECAYRFLADGTVWEQWNALEDALAASPAGAGSVGQRERIADCVARAKRFWEVVDGAALTAAPAAAETVAQDASEALFMQGKEEGAADAIQRVAERIGIDSEYRWSTDPERSQGGPVELLDRIVEHVADLAGTRQSAQAGAGDRFVLVPINPSEAMCRAGMNVSGLKYARLCSTWWDMLAAAPIGTGNGEASGS